MKTYHFITYDSRFVAWPGIKILALSLAEHCPGHRLTVFADEVPDEVARWFREHAAYVSLQIFEGGVDSWDVKPKVIEHAVRSLGEIVWIDSDVLVTGNLGVWLDRFSPEALVYAQDGHPHPREQDRCGVLGLEVRRKLPAAVNTGFLRVGTGEAHMRMLHHWQMLLTDPRYRHATTLSFEENNCMMSDQDVLEAVLASGLPGDEQELPLGILRVGVEHVTALAPHWFTIPARFRTVAGLTKPLIVHAQGAAPWRAQTWPGGLLSGSHWLVNPYIILVRPYCRRLTAEETSWLRVRRPVADACRLVTLGNPYLQGIPLILIESWNQSVNNALGKMRKCFRHS